MRLRLRRKPDETDPLSPVIGASLGMILYLARRYDQAADVLKHSQEITPDHFLPHMRMGLLRIQQRKYDEAIEELKAAVDLALRSTETLAALATAHAASGDVNNARTILDELENPAGKRYVLPYNIARIYAAMGDAEKAFVWLDTSYKEGNPDLIELNSEPVFDGIRADSRFRELMRRVGWKV